MAFVVEWDNPIFYLNFAGLVLGIILYLRARKNESQIKWTWLVLVVGTGLHFIGDLFEFPEASDHILIHTVVAIALLVALLTAGAD